MTWLAAAIAFAVVIAGSAGTADADPQKSNLPSEKCLSSTDPFDAAFCLGYVSGFIDAGQAAASAPVGGGMIAGFSFCPPRGATARQAVGIVVRWLRDNPAYRYYAPGGWVAAALSIAWPCR
jgi:hypothetical protein